MEDAEEPLPSEQGAAADSTGASDHGSIWTGPRASYPWNVKKQRVELESLATKLRLALTGPGGDAAEDGHAAATENGEMAAGGPCQLDEDRSHQTADDRKNTR